MKIFKDFRLKQYLILLVGLLLSASTAYGQSCTESHYLATPDEVSGHSNVGQSFTASCDGNMTTITVEYLSIPATTQDRILNIYDGGDWNATLLHTQVVPHSSLVVGNNVFVLSTPINIGLGEINSWEITDATSSSTSANGVAFVSGNPYANGQAWYSDDFIGGIYDGNFEVFIEAEPASIPTLGQWGLIILGLMFLILAVNYLMNGVNISLKYDKIT